MYSDDSESQLMEISNCYVKFEFGQSAKTQEHRLLSRITTAASSATTSWDLH
jgi:hypothetical protein